MTTGFERLHPEIKRWIWEQKWESLRAVQEETIHAIFDGSADILVSAGTASGKTEAAFLPILSQVVDQREAGLSALYVSPLKALINDQFRRLEALCEDIDIGVVRWHGDAPQAAKARLIKRPSGVALITPESIEALLIRKPAAAAKLFANLDFIVIDELHAFLNGARGLHLASLLRRVDLLAEKRARRIGLSATLGDFSQAKAWLNPASPENVCLINPNGEGPELQLQIRAYVDDPRVADAYGVEEDDAQWHPSAFDRIADHLFTQLKGNNNLVFAGSRKRVETLSDRLRRRSEKAGVPNEFFPHHGNLSKDLREELEVRLKVGNLPTTGVATTTLELGIDIGSVKSVAQIGPPTSMSSLRQRLGRSGRRHGAPAILRMYLREPFLSSDAGIPAALRFNVAQSVAAVQLLIRRFVEPAETDPSVATVVLHQILSIICERGALRADQLFEVLCCGPLAAMDKVNFLALLRGMVAERLIEQAPDRSIMLGELGEKLTSRHDFYAIFETDEEWRLVASGKTLGTVPVSNVVSIGILVMFGGQRWKVIGVDEKAKVLDVTLHRSAAPPQFEDRGWGGLHDEFVAQIRAVFEQDDVPPYLDTTAAELLKQGRQAYRALQLSTQRIVEFNRDTHLFVWAGAEMCSVMQVALLTAGLTVESPVDGVITVLGTDEATVRALLDQLILSPPDGPTLSGFAENLRGAKYDDLIPETVLRSLWEQRYKRHIERLSALTQDLLSA